MGHKQMFQINKVSRFIRDYGEEFVFKRSRLNEFKEPIKGEFDEVRVFGVYHEINSQVSEVTTEGAVLRTKQQPRIFCMLDAKVQVMQGDTLYYKGLKFKVVDPANVSLSEICVDISMEVIEDVK